MNYCFMVLFFEHAIHSVQELIDISATFGLQSLFPEEKALWVNYSNSSLSFRIKSSAAAVWFCWDSYIPKAGVKIKPVSAWIKTLWLQNRSQSGKFLKQRQTIGLRQTEKSCLTFPAEPIAWLKLHAVPYKQARHKQGWIFENWALIYINDCGRRATHKTPRGCHGVSYCLFLEGWHQFYLLPIFHNHQHESFTKFMRRQISSHMKTYM